MPSYATATPVNSKPHHGAKFPGVTIVLPHDAEKDRNIRNTAPSLLQRADQVIE